MLTHPIGGEEKVNKNGFSCPEVILSGKQKK